jgi:hypothetical protein
VRSFIVGAVSERSDWGEETEGEGRYVPVPLECVECRLQSDEGARWWRAYRIDDPGEGELPALAFYCPVCAEREFGSLDRSSEPLDHSW